MSRLGRTDEVLPRLEGCLRREIEALGADHEEVLEIRQARAAILGPEE